MKSFLVIIIAVVVLLIIAGVTYSILNNPPQPEPSPQGAAPAEPSPPAAPAAEPPSPPKESPSPITTPAPSFEEKVENFMQAIADVSATGESKEVTLVFTEAEVNEQAAKLLSQVEMPEDIPIEIRSVYIDLKADNNIVAEVETVTYDIGVTIKVKTQVGVKEGKPDVEVTDVSFGNPLLDALLKDRITALITQKIDDLLVQLTEAEIGGDGVASEFKDINTQEEEVTITVIIKPKA